MITDEDLRAWAVTADRVDRRYTSGEPWFATEREREFCAAVPLLIAEIRELRAALAEARGRQPSGFWSQRQWEDWSNELAELIPEDDVSRYSNPEGAQEGIIEDCFRAYVVEVLQARALLEGEGR